MIAPHLQHSLLKRRSESPAQTPVDTDNDNDDDDDDNAKNKDDRSNDDTSASHPPPQPQTRPHPKPAYLATTTNSPLVIDVDLYTRIQSAARSSPAAAAYTLPPRSGLAIPVPRRSILRISTPRGPQVVDLNAFSRANPAEHFWASRTRQLHSSHLSTHDRLWSNLPYLRPMLTMIADSLAARFGRGGDEGGGGGGGGGGINTHHNNNNNNSNAISEFGGRCHDLLGTRCDPYVNRLLSSSDYDYHCHSNLVRAIAPYGLPESAVHDVLNLFQVTGLDAQGRYFMEASLAREGDFVEFFAEQELLVALSTCPGGDLSKWGFGAQGEEAMRECCREARVEVFKLEDEEAVLKGWTEPQSPRYRGMHGMTVPMGEGRGEGVKSSNGNSSSG